MGKDGIFCFVNLLIHALISPIDCNLPVEYIS